MKSLGLKLNYFVIIILSLGIYSCKSVNSQNVDSVKNEDTKNTLTDNTPKTRGVVSYKSGDCGLQLIIVKKDDGKEVVLIPFPQLSIKDYAEGSIILFKYNHTKRMQPKNCSGKPVLIKEIETI